MWVARGCPSFVQPPTSQRKYELVGARRLRAGAHAFDDRARELERGSNPDTARRRGAAVARPPGGGTDGPCDSGGIRIVRGLMRTQGGKFGKWSSSKAGRGGRGGLGGGQLQGLTP